MSVKSFTYPTDTPIIEGLAHCIEELRKAPDTGALWPPPPTVEQLEELLNCSFATSLETEEGRNIAFTVSFFEGPQYQFSYTMRHPLPLSPGSLARLAVALDPWRARICVVPNGSALQITGIIHLGEQDAYHGVRNTVPQLSVRVLGPGILLVRYGPQLLLTYRRGRYEFHSGPSARVNLYGALGAPSFRSLQGRTAGQLGEDVRFMAALVRIARTMLAARHGGTLLILPHGATWEDRAPSRRYEPSAPVAVVKEAQARHREWQNTRDEVVKEIAQGNVRPEAMWILADPLTPSRLTSELEWLGGLTATDGMTVILPDLTLLGFGVFFDTQEGADLATRVVVIDPYDDGADPQPKDLASLGGARHQSAAVTCRHFPGAIAVVASQDGSLSSMTWDDKDKVVTVFRHLELLLDI
jgi:hypothetical protein